MKGGDLDGPGPRVPLARWAFAASVVAVALSLVSLTLTLLRGSP